ncbi:unnamed protein product [Rotaria magnacalcarata]
MCEALMSYLSNKPSQAFVAKIVTLLLHQTIVSLSSFCLFPKPHHKSSIWGIRIQMAKLSSAAACLLHVKRSTMRHLCT